MMSLLSAFERDGRIFQRWHYRHRRPNMNQPPARFSLPLSPLTKRRWNFLKLADAGTPVPCAAAGTADVSEFPVYGIISISVYIALSNSANDGNAFRAACGWHRACAD
ncbi:MAG: hypothetical protein U0694_13790 [Anaerolineae bacterium]